MDELKMVLETHQKGEKLNGIDFTVVEILISFLKPFEDATKALEGDLRPTIHYVYLWNKKLLAQMQTYPTALPLLKFLNKRGRKSIEQKFQINSVHKLALFFHPKFKALRPFSYNEQALIHAHANDLLKLLSAASSEDLECMDHNYSYEPSSSSVSARLNICNRSIDDEFLEWHCPLPAVSEKNEVEKYIQ